MASAGGEHGTFAIESLSVDNTNKYLQVKYTTEKDILEYPLIWLRDACLCPECLQPGGRQTMLIDLDPDLSARSAKLDHETGKVKITWPDDHASLYPPGWLWDRRYTQDAKDMWKAEFALKPKLWGSEITDDFPIMDFTKVMNDDRVYYEWLVILEEVGICLIRGSPCKEGVVKQLGKRIAYNRNTCFGEESQIRLKDNPSDVTFTTKVLGLHVDLPYCTFSPGVQFLHCIKQAEIGGDNQFCDGFHAAKILREDYPENFCLLTKYNFYYEDQADIIFPYHLMTITPCISLNDEGEIVKVVFDDTKRAYHASHLPIDVVRPLYKAMHKFSEIMSGPRCLIQMKLQPGEMITFNNHRVLHARSAFSVRSAEERLLALGYVDWDEMRSARRTMKIKLGI